MQARYYDPVIGRFYSNDPVDVMGHISRGNPIHGFNRYTYANNNPYKYVDPDGEFGMFVTGLIGDALNVAFEYAFNDNPTKTDLAVAFGKGVAMGMTGSGLIKAGTEAMKTMTKIEQGVTKAYLGGSGAFVTSVATDHATNASGITNKSDSEIASDGVSNALGSGGGNKAANGLKSLMKNENVSDTAGETIGAGITTAINEIKEEL